MQLRTEPRWERVMHRVAGGVATTLWRTGDAIERAGYGIERVGNAVNDAGHKVIGAAIAVSEGPLGGLTVSELLDVAEDVRRGAGVNR